MKANKKKIKASGKKTIKAAASKPKKKISPASKSAGKGVKKAVKKAPAKKMVSQSLAQPAKKSSKKIAAKKTAVKVELPAAALHPALSPAEISRLAILQNKAVLKINYKNIEALSDTLKNGKHVVAIYLRDHQTRGLPVELQVLLPDGSFAKVKTEIVAGAGEAAPHIGQATDEISDTNSKNYMGTICCMVSSTTDPGFRGLVTSGHIFTYGEYFDYGGVLAARQKRDALLNGQPKATLFFQQMNSHQDLAIAELTDQAGALNNYRSFSAPPYTVSDDDLKSPQPNVTIVSRQNNIRDAYILDYNVSFDVKYFNTSKEINNIILIGSTNDRSNSTTVSTGGDSGSAVYHKGTGRLIGMLLGGNNKFSFVLPLEETLTSFNFKII